MMKSILTLFILVISFQAFSQAIEPHQGSGPEEDKEISSIKTQYAKEHLSLTEAIKEDDIVDSSEYPENLKALYWDIYKKYATDILNFKERSPELSKALTKYESLKPYLVQLEYKEKEADKLNDKVMAYLKYLEEKIFKYSYSAFIEYLSWQKQTELNVGSSLNDVVITNRAICVGGEGSYENKFFRFFVDGCLLFGKGNVKRVKPSLEYEQSGLELMGLKSGIGIGKVISSKAEIGLKLPIMLVSQTLTDPPVSSPACATGCEVEQPKFFNIMTSMYGRWNVDKVYFQTEFGKFIDSDDVLWSLRLGYKF